MDKSEIQTYSSRRPLTLQAILLAHRDEYQITTLPKGNNDSEEIEENIKSVIECWLNRESDFQFLESVVLRRL